MILKKLLSTILSDSQPASPEQPTETDPGFQQRAAEQRRILNEAVRQHAPAFWNFKLQVEREAPRQTWSYTDRFKQIVAEQPILKDTPQARIGMVIALTYWFTEKTKSLENVKLIDDWQHRQAAQHLITRLLNYKLPYTPAELTLVLNLLARHTDYEGTRYMYYLPVSTMLKRVEELVEADGLTPDMEQALKRFKEIIRGQKNEQRRFRLRIQALLGETVLSGLSPGLLWLDTLKADIQAMEVDKRRLWEYLIEHSMTPRSSKPSVFG